MTEEVLASWSNLLITLAAVGYFLAFLAHLGEWASRRATAPSRAVQRVPAMAGAGDPPPVPTAPVRPAPPGRWESRLGRAGLALTVLAVVPHLLSLVTRGLAADPIRVPWGNMYEFTLTACAIVVLLYLAAWKRLSLAWLGPVVTGFVVTVLMVAVLVLYVPPVSLTPALHSPWLVIHVIAAMTATGAFTVGGMTSALYLFKERHLARGGSDAGYLGRLPALDVLDRVSYRMHAFGFPVWTFAALIAGPIWAHYAWSRYWGWDPKEIWAFVTWVVYAAYLHSRATAGWRGHRASLVALLGLATLWFNFVGINFFFGSGSMHSYATGVVHGALAVSG